MSDHVSPVSFRRRKNSRWRIGDGVVAPGVRRPCLLFFENHVVPSAFSVVMVPKLGLAILFAQGCRREIFGANAHTVVVRFGIESAESVPEEEVGSIKGGSGALLCGGRFRGPMEFRRAVKVLSAMLGRAQIPMRKMSVSSVRRGSVPKSASVLRGKWAELRKN